MSAGCACASVMTPQPRGASGKPRMHPIWTLLRCVAAASLIFFLAATALAQPRAGADHNGARPRAVELDGAERLAIDGRLDELAWQSAPLHERFVQFLP